MGNTNIRHVLKSMSSWSDKECKLRHKHDYLIESYMQLRRSNYSIQYYHVMKCSKCNSFKSIPKQGAVNGFVQEPTLKLPVFKMFTRHKHIIEFKDLVEDVGQ